MLGTINGVIVSECFSVEQAKSDLESIISSTNDQETLEEAAENYVKDESNRTYRFISKDSFQDGAKWQQKRMYSEEDIIRFMQYIISNPDLHNTSSVSETTAKYYIEQFKKKV